MIIHSRFYDPDAVVCEIKRNNVVHEITLDDLLKLADLKDANIMNSLKYENTNLKLAIKNVIFNNPATIVEWLDGTKTVVTCQDNIKYITVRKDGKDIVTKKPMPSDTYDRYIGLSMCIIKKLAGNKANFSNEINKWIKYDDKRQDEERAKLKKHEENVKKNAEQMKIHEQREAEKHAKE